MGVALLVNVGAELVVRWRVGELPEPTLWSGPEMGVKEQRIGVLERHRGASVLFLGSSTVDAGVDPSRLGIEEVNRPAYNAATGAGSLDMIDFWARHVAVPRLDPDVVVLGVVSRELNPNNPEFRSLERAFFTSKAVIRLAGRESLLEQIERKVESWSVLVRYRTVLREPSNLWNDGPDGQTYGEIVADDGQYEGFLGGTYSPSTKVSRFLQRNAVHDFVVGAREIERLRDLVRFVKGSGARVMVVNMPVTADYVDLHPAGGLDYDDYLGSLEEAAATAGAPFVDVGVWPDELFADPVHLNAAGAARLTELLGLELRQLLAG